MSKDLGAISLYGLVVKAVIDEAIPSTISAVRPRL